MWDRRRRRNVAPSTPVAECGTGRAKIMLDRRSQKNVGASLPKKMLDRRGYRPSGQHSSTVPHLVPVRRYHIVGWNAGPSPPHIRRSHIPRPVGPPVPHFSPPHAPASAECWTAGPAAARRARKVGPSPRDGMWDRRGRWRRSHILLPQRRSHIFVTAVSVPSLFPQGRRSHLFLAGTVPHFSPARANTAHCGTAGGHPP